MRPGTNACAGITASVSDAPELHRHDRAGRPHSDGVLDSRAGTPSKKALHRGASRRNRAGFMAAGRRPKPSRAGSPQEHGRAGSLFGADKGASGIVRAGIRPARPYRTLGISGTHPPTTRQTLSEVAL